MLKHHYRFIESPNELLFLFDHYLVVCSKPSEFVCVCVCANNGLDSTHSWTCGCTELLRKSLRFRCWSWCHYFYLFIFCDWQWHHYSQFSNPYAFRIYDTISEPMKPKERIEYSQLNSLQFYQSIDWRQYLLRLIAAKRMENSLQTFWHPHPTHTHAANLCEPEHLNMLRFARLLSRRAATHDPHATLHASRIYLFDSYDAYFHVLHFLLRLEFLRRKQDWLSEPTNMCKMLAATSECENRQKTNGIAKWNCYLWNVNSKMRQHQHPAYWSHLSSN